ncbi:MAG: type II toxin-antitoxin system RelE/ParE family toxin [Ignavibacteria bacterium]
MAKIEKIIWSLKSIENLEDILNYISKNSPLYAPVCPRIISSVDRFIDFPLSGRVVPEYNDENIREIIFHNYRIVPTGSKLK